MPTVRQLYIMNGLHPEDENGPYDTASDFVGPPDSENRAFEDRKRTFAEIVANVPKWKGKSPIFGAGENKNIMVDPDGTIVNINNPADFSPWASFWSEEDPHWQKEADQVDTIKGLIKNGVYDRPTASKSFFPFESLPEQIQEHYTWGENKPLGWDLRNLPPKQVFYLKRLKAAKKT